MIEGTFGSTEMTSGESMIYASSPPISTDHSRSVMNQLAKSVRTFDLRSFLSNAKTPANTHSVTNASYSINSVAVKVGIASNNNSEAFLNDRIESNCKPVYTFNRFRRSQSPPSSTNLSITHTFTSSIRIERGRRGERRETYFCARSIWEEMSCWS